MSKLQDTLTGLGSTTEEIRQFLANKQVTGVPDECRKCVLVRYLEYLGFTTVSVDWTKETEGEHDGPKIIRSQYAVIRAGFDEVVVTGVDSELPLFLEAFDRGDYPELVSQQ